jgi:7,8-dihydropterin-6-yl-methyl-4-(beta-D-ribofuranosyl)aminobenzene 5'-phosphate synthase
MGTSGAFADNAQQLGIDLRTVEVAVLSHHHFDHGGGLRRFFEENPNASVYLGESPAGEPFTKRKVRHKYVGLDRSLLADFPTRFITTCEPKEVLPDVYLFPHITGPYSKPAGNRTLDVRQNGKYASDDFAHELVMAIKENEQLVVFSGCSHNGVLNMVDTVTRALPDLPVKAVIGGFHLVTPPPTRELADSPAEIESLAREMLAFPIGKAYTGHCTSDKALVILKGVMGERLEQIRTGSIVEI